MMPANHYSNNVSQHAHMAGITATAGNANDRGGLHPAWEAWAGQAEPGENRSEAVLKLKDCLERNATTLDLSGLGLRMLPNQLTPCERLIVDNNRLTRLPPL